MGGMPGMLPGQIVCGNISFCAGEPSSTGGILIKLSSSFGNLKPASLNALPKSLSFGKSEWQVAQDVPYCRENAGMASPRCGEATIKVRATTRETTTEQRA